MYIHKKNELSVVRINSYHVWLVGYNDGLCFGCGDKNLLPDVTFYEESKIDQLPYAHFSNCCSVCGLGWITMYKEDLRKVNNE